MSRKKRIGSGLMKIFRILKNDFINDYNYYNYVKMNAKLKGLSSVNCRLQSSTILIINNPTFKAQFILAL